MPRTRLLPDDLVRQLVAVGQVDVLVGLPTFNHADTASELVRTLHIGLARHFPRERTVILNADGGSDDGTPDVVREAPMADAERASSPSLRTTHRVSARHTGEPGRAGGVRTVFAAADLLRAKVVVLVNADAAGMTPDWVRGLAQPVWQDESDVVLPVHARHRLEGPLLTQLVRPLLGAAFGRRLRSHLAGDFGCTGGFAARMVHHPVWEREPTHATLDVWVAAAAMADDLRLCQAHLGPSTPAARTHRPRLAEVFDDVVGSTFACLVHYGPRWLGRSEAMTVPEAGQPAPAPSPHAGADLPPMVERFRAGVRDLAPLLREVVTAATMARLHEVATEAGPVPRVPDSLWVNVVYEFAAAAHRGVMGRDHLTRALLPLYLGRAASFIAETASADEPTHLQRLDALERTYEGQRPHLIERWMADGGR